MSIVLIINDGGRAEAGFKGSAGDCVARAIAITTGLSYSQVYADLASGRGAQRRSPGGKKKSASARSGIDTSRKWFKTYMDELGFEWVPTMKIGEGCTTHLTAEELPMGRIIVSLSGHYAAVIDRELHDTHDCSRGGTRCVYGYWRLRPDRFTIVITAHKSQGGTYPVIARQEVAMPVNEAWARAAGRPVDGMDLDYGLPMDEAREID